MELQDDHFRPGFWSTCPLLQLIASVEIHRAEEGHVKQQQNPGQKLHGFHVSRHTQKSQVLRA